MKRTVIRVMLLALAMGAGAQQQTKRKAGAQLGTTGRNICS
jgi:hypothetical protein